MMPTFHFVRHCESTFNRSGHLAGSMNVGLSLYGYWQCLRLLGLSRALGAERIVSSDLKRAVRTAQAIRFRGHTPLILSHEIRERAGGMFEGWAKPVLERTGVLTKLRRWDFRPPGGESRRDVAMRALSFFRDLPAAGTTIVVSHGTLLEALLEVVDQRPRDGGRIANGGVISRIVPPETWEARLEWLTKSLDGGGIWTENG